MNVIANRTLLVRRLSEARRRRVAVVSHQERLRGSLPRGRWRRCGLRG